VLLTVSLSYAAQLPLFPQLRGTAYHDASEFAQGRSQDARYLGGWLGDFPVASFPGSVNAFRIVVSRVWVNDRSIKLLCFGAPAHNTFFQSSSSRVIGFALFCALLAVLALSVRAMPSLTQRLWIVWLGFGCGASVNLEMPNQLVLLRLLMAQCGCMARTRGMESHAQTF